MARRVSGTGALQGARVETTDGRFLGHVIDLRCTWRPGDDAPLVAHTLVVGRLGWVVRLGFKEHGGATLPWSSVRAVDPDGRRVVVAASAAGTLSRAT